MTTKPHATCRRVDDTYLTRQHHPDCKSTACTGCQPCTHDHAGNPGRRRKGWHRCLPFSDLRHHFLLWSLRLLPLVGRV